MAQLWATAHHSGTATARMDSESEAGLQALREANLLCVRPTCFAFAGASSS
jgi:hypothetical protein